MTDDAKAIAIIFKNSGVGLAGEQPFRDKLRKTYLALTQQNPNLKPSICFYAEGARLGCEGSPVLNARCAREEADVRLSFYQICLDTFGIQDKLQVGIVGWMVNMSTTMVQADSLLTV